MISITNKIFEPNNIRSEFNPQSLPNYSSDINTSSTKYYNDYQTKKTMQNQNLIAKKTNRGRREKRKIPTDKLKCEVCLAFSDYLKEKLISCSVCNCFFHKSCYNQYEEYISPTEDKIYKCIRCVNAIKLNKSIYDFKCFICNHSNQVLKYNKYKEIYYHQICLDNLPELSDLKEEEIDKAFIKKWRYKNSCKYCGQKLSKLVAVTKCKKPKCKEYYHFPCAINKGLIFNLDFMKQYYHVSNYKQIPFYCSKHNKNISNQYKSYINCNKNNESKSKNNYELNKNIKKIPEELQEDLNKNEKEEKEKIQDEWNTIVFKEKNENFWLYNNNESLDEKTFEEKKENYDEQNIDDINENSNEELINININKSLFFNINDKNSLNRIGFESNNKCFDMSFNTKNHHINESYLVLNRRSSSTLKL